MCIRDRGNTTTGTVTVSNAVTITGNHDQATAALVTEATKVAAATAVVTINDADSTEVNASELSAIGNTTTGAVTATGALAIDGTHAELTAALVTEETKVVAGKTGTTATVSNALTAATAASLAGVNNVTAIFSAGVTDEIGNLTTGNAVHSNVTVFTTEDSDVAITVDDNAGGGLSLIHI